MGRDYTLESGLSASRVQSSGGVRSIGFLLPGYSRSETG
jgi:hypothetical protein